MDMGKKLLPDDEDVAPRPRPTPRPVRLGWDDNCATASS